MSINIKNDCKLTSVFLLIYSSKYSSGLVSIFEVNRISDVNYVTC